MALEDLFQKRELELIRLGVTTLEDRLKRERGRLEGLNDEAVACVDRDLEILRGRGPTAPGLKARLGVRSNGDPDPDQTDLGEELAKTEEEGDPFAPDLRTQGLTVDEGKALVNRILQDEPPAAAVRKLNALRAGEKERTPKARVTLLSHIQAAIDTAKEKVQAGEVSH